MISIKPVIFLISVLVAISMATGPGPPNNPGNGGGGPPENPGNGGGGPPECPGNSCENGNKDKEPPNIQINQSENELNRGSTNNLTVNIEDNHNISTIYLLTNETGKMERKKSHGSPKTVYKDQANLSFQWSNFSIKNRSVKWKVFANDTNGNSRNSSSKSFKVFSEPKFELNRLELENQSTIKEGDKVEIAANITNTGTSSFPQGFNLDINTDEGSGYFKKDEISKNGSLGINESKKLVFSWNAEPGPYRFTLDTDNGNISSRFEKSATVDVSSHQIYYGDTNIQVTLSSENDMFFRLESDNSKGRIYFSDYDTNYLFSDLQPIENLEGLKQADEELELVGHNDSLEKLFDEDNNGLIDDFQELEVGQRTLTAPAIDSTSSGSFKTFLLYNSKEGDSYDGSQDLVFVTPLKNDFEGEFGLYDYETKIPSTLGSLSGQSDKISIYTEIE